MRRYLIWALSIILISLVFFTDFFLKKERPLDEVFILQRENADLKAQIQQCGSGGFKPSSISALGTSGVKAKVFSAYPFNTKNQLAINVGENAGVQTSMPAILGESILVGRVKEVMRNASIVQTLFDPRFELSVRIGKEEVDALFQGGNEPRIILIDKSKTISVGDPVYSAGADFPYGLKIGEIAEIRENTAGVFKEAILKIPFGVNDLRELNILTNR